MWKINKLRDNPPKKGDCNVPGVADVADFAYLTRGAAGCVLGADPQILGVCMAQFARGDVVTHRPDGMFVVWSETLGVVHCMPAVYAGPAGRPLPLPGDPQYRVRAVAEVGVEPTAMWVDTETRRHFPSGTVEKRGEVQQAAIGLIGTALVRQAQDIAAEDQQRRDGTVVAALVRQRDRNRLQMERMAA